MDIKKIVFVCTVNRHRSVIAEHLFRRVLENKKKGLEALIEASSAGIVTKEQKHAMRRSGVAVVRPLFGYRPMPCLIFYMQKAGIDVSENRSKPLSLAMAKRADLIIAMGESHKQSILARYPKARDKTYTLAEVSYPFEFENIVVKEPPGFMPPSKFCMLQCDHWAITETAMKDIDRHLEAGLTRIMELLGMRV